MSDWAKPALADLRLCCCAAVQSRFTCLGFQKRMCIRCVQAGRATVSMCWRRTDLVLRVYEVLDLGLRELAHAQQPCARRDLIAVGLPDLRGCKGQLAAIVVQEVPAQTHLTGRLGIYLIQVISQACQSALVWRLLVLPKLLTTVRRLVDCHGTAPCEVSCGKVGCSRAHLKLTKMPCAVSGRRKPVRSPLGPMEVRNMRLKLKGAEMAFLVSGAVTSYTVSAAPSCCASSSSMRLSRPSTSCKCHRLTGRAAPRGTRC